MFGRKSASSNGPLALQRSCVEFRGGSTRIELKAGSMAYDGERSHPRLANEEARRK